MTDRHLPVRGRVANLSAYPLSAPTGAPDV